MSIVDTTFITETVNKNRRRRRQHPVKYQVTDKGRIEFLKSPFQLKDELKSMKGSRWHGFIEGDNRKIWSVEDCHRNRFQMEFLQGGNPYTWFDRDIIKHTYPKFGSSDFGYFDLMSQQRTMADALLTYHYQIWGAIMGSGKGGLSTTKVYTPDGWSLMGELRVGDEIIDPQGGTCTVTGVYPRGKMEMFRVTFTDGSQTTCSGDHLWRVITPRQKCIDGDYEVIELQELVNRNLQYSNGNNKWFIPMVEPVQFNDRDLLCHPYVMGYILGNGHLPQYKVSISDQETVSRLNSLMDEPLAPLKATLEGKKIDYTIKCPRTKAAIDGYGLKSCLAATKFVHQDFLLNTIENRVALLQGLLDSDGTQGGKAGIEFSSASDNLATSMVFLIRSLGGTCHRGLKEEPAYSYKGEKRTGQPSHRIHGSFSDKITPFLLSRKAELYTVPTKYQPTRAIVSVESVGLDECICIRVDSSTHCYVTDEFIVTHNTLAAIAAMKLSQTRGWWWVGPKSSLYGIRQEFDKWGLHEGAVSQMMSYDRMVSTLREWRSGTPAPIGVVFDESHQLKTATTQRSQCAQKLADAIRDEYGNDGYVLLMTGTPSPKRPSDWWSPCEIAWPGFIKEGDVSSFERRMAFFRLRDDLAGQAFNTHIAWKDNPERCKHCGYFLDEGHHILDNGEIIEEDTAFDAHVWEPSANEVAEMYERLQGLATFIHAKDCPELPDIVYKEIHCEPTPSLLRVASAITRTAKNVITGLTALRELSDGFQYREVEDGYEECKACTDGTEERWFHPNDPEGSIPDRELLSEEFVSELQQETVKCGACKGTLKVTKYKRITREVPCPKEDAVVDLLSQNEEQGRIVFFAGFTGSLDRITKVCQREGWDTIRLDGRGYRIERLTGRPHDDGSPETELIKLPNPLNYWIQNPERKIAFVAHPKSGGVSLTLCEQKNRPGARLACFYSNDYDPASRTQAEYRIKREGMIGWATIVDLFHLPTDTRVLKVLRANRKLELTTMGALQEDYDE